MPTAKALGEYYASFYDSQKWNDTPQSVHFANPQRLIDHIFGVASGASSAEILRILDFGGGDGSIAVGLAKKFRAEGVDQVRVQVVDYGTDNSIDPGDRAITVVRSEALASRPEGHFNLVVASASLEHLPDPGRALKTLLLSLGPGGIFYARTPDFVPLVQLASRVGVAIDLGFPAHLHDLGQPFWDSILGTLGLKADFDLLKSQPSIVESTFRAAFVRTLMAYMLKSPWYIVGRRWRLVGGWEVFARRRESTVF